MYLAIIMFPLIGSIVSGFFGRKVGIRGSQLITCSCVIITTILAIVAFIEVGLNNNPVTIDLISWIDVGSVNIFWGFYFDSLTVSMLIPVLIVSSLVHVYSIGYMSHDPHNQRFFSYLSLFTFMMIILVTANNFLLMFVGWEGVGICSYLLVSFWFTRIAANQSSMSAFLTNRVGDCFLTIGMFAMLWSFGNVDYSTIFSLSPYYSENVIILVGICLLIGAMAKSSQVGLHVWLPMAMEGPTPVSALIHAATMVTAGVYLLMRASPLIEYSSTILILCLWVGAITTVFSSLVGLFQQDIKKVIAYSTMSQLGMMIIAVGLSSYNIALFHLVNHAFYKGLLFLGAGAVIHAVSDNQDFRKYGGLIYYLPLTYSVMLIASLSLVAIPFMTGFYSKDFILESTFGQYHISSIIVYFIAIIGAMFTTLYSVKVLYLTFLSNPNGPLVNYKQAAPHNGEGDIFMSMPLIILAVFSIFFGYLTKDIFIGLASGFFSDNSLFIHPLHETTLDTEFAIPTLFKLLPLFLTICLSLISLLFTEFYPRLLVSFKFTNFGYNIFSFFNQRFLVELFYNKYISGIILKLGGQTTKDMDKGLVEFIGPYGLQRNLTNLSISINNLSTGVVTSYALYILIGLISYQCVLYYSNFVDDFLEVLLLILFCLINSTKNSKPKNHLSNAEYSHTLISLPLIMCGYCLILLIDPQLMPQILRSLNDMDAYVYNLFNKDVLKNTVSIASKIAEIMPVIPAAYDFFVGVLTSTTTTTACNQTPALFSPEFMTRHDTLYGTGFDINYFTLLRGLFDEYQALVQWQEELQVNYDAFIQFFETNLHRSFITNYATTGSNFGDSMQTFQNAEGFTARFQELTDLLVNFTTTYTNYRSSIRIINELVPQVLTLNPNFTLPNPGLNPVVVTPYEWFVLQYFTSGYIWDPMMFTFAGIVPHELVHFAAITRNMPINALTSYFVFRDSNRSRAQELSHPFIDNPLHPFNLVEEDPNESVDDNEADPNPDPDPDGG